MTTIDLLTENFDGLGAGIDRSAGWDMIDGEIRTNDGNEGRMTLDTVDATGLESTKLTFDARTDLLSGESFEGRGSTGADVLRVLLLDADGNRIATLDVFHGDGDQMTSRKTGNSITSDGVTLEYDLPEGLTEFKIAFASNLSSQNELVYLDNVSITAQDVTDAVVDSSTEAGDDTIDGGDSGNSPSAGGEGVLGTTLGDGPGSTGGGYARISAQSVYNGNHSFSTDAFYLGNDIPVLDDANRNAITGVSFSQDGEGTDRTFGLDELEFTGAQRSFVGLVTVQDSDIWRANDQFSSSISGGFQDTSVVSSGTADFTMNDGQVFQGIRVNFVRGPDGETYMMPDDGPSPGAFNAFRNMLANNNSGIDSFTIATGSGDDNGINPIEGNWADGQFFELNAVVDGENFAEVMNPEYNDANAPTDSGGDIIDGADGENDIILGNGGDDVINAGLGDDEVYGGSGDDVIDGGAGNDTLTGDFASDVTDIVVDNSTVEGDDILEGGAGDDVIYGDSGNSPSAGGEGVLGTTLGDGPGSTGGGYARVSAQPVYNGNHSFSTDAFYLGNDIPVLDDANRNAITGVSFSQDGEGTDRTFGLDELEFTGAQRSFVGLVTVQDSDIWRANDQFSSSISGGFQDTSVVSSGTADFTMNDGQVFQGIRVNFVRGPDGETYMMPDDGPSPGAFNAFRNMLANNNSGIDSFTIATGSGDDNGINPIEGNWADGQFFELTERDGGDDTIIGGEGADQMFGEGGDDTFLVTTASDAAGDVVVGGNGPDQNTDNDVLDLTGAGAVTIVEDVDITDAGATTGTVTFEDGSVLTFSQIEEIITDPLNAAPDAIDDAAILDPGTDLLLDLLGNDSDPDSDPLTIIAASDGIVVGGGDTTLTTDGGRPVVVTVAPSGAVTALLVSVADDYLPLGEGDTDAVSFTYTISDGNGLTDTATVSIDIEGENDDPVITTPSAITALDDDPDIGDTVALIQASDVDLGDVLTFSITPDATDDSAGFAIDPVTGAVSITPGFTLPDADADFLWEFEVVVTDSFGATDTLDVELSFGPGTPPPADPGCGGLGDPSSSPVTPGVSFDGTNDSETIQGTDIGDTISGNGGDDTIFGNGGDDTLLGNAGNDVLCGGLGNDQIHGGRDGDILLGGAGDDRVGGNRDDDQIQGGQGQDELEGEGGADLFVIDTLHILSGPLNDDTIIDFEAGIDTITFENLGTTAVSFATIGADTTVLLDGQLALTVQNATEAEVAAGIVDESTVSIFSF